MFKNTFPWAKVVSSFVIGAAAGAAAALLLAPMSGRKMQKQVRNVVGQQVDSVEKMIKKVANA